MTEQKYGDVSVALNEFVAQVEIHRPPHNFFDVALIRNLADAFNALDADPACRAIVLSAEGKSFCAGANFAQRSFGSTAGSDSPASGNPLYSEGVRLFACKKPVVAAIQGAAIGGGLGLALVADFRVASPEARFAANFVKIGIHPGFGLTHTLPRLIGQQRANLMFYTGRRITGEEALAWGLADILVEPARLREAATGLAKEIAENAPLAVLSTRATMRRGLAEAVKAQTDLEFVEQNWLSKTEDHREGVKAVAERRPGQFAGK
ncbi:MAG: enoyl-CoA hydratase/isomerase family protein [Candidatus Binatus sp.]|uniref:enoyl-CoA hydratase/isomerase family protein n=1 Tax=Candidatus Binatus sp. TaxID=2811406 RepID=UPI002725C2CB|nr:enoyl-CoA hydratase/isomerase family protein [Candidatus Binatus sp.]MDO8431167.1 enoyl-CoA hydratase/isomerase family protein [Candidatus Binatus sp.]